MLICGSLIGCRPGARYGNTGLKPYWGPTLTMRQLVSEINQNNERVPTLRAEGTFEAHLNDQGKDRTLIGDVTLLYAQPQSMRLIGKSVAGTIFDVASNLDRYWVILKGDIDTMYTGLYRNLDQVDADRIPVRPDLLLEVLGVQPINTNFLQQPAPVLRFNNAARAYMLVWSSRLPDRWAAQKEVWYDVDTRLPTMVLMFDENGRIVLRAYLRDHQPVKAAGLPEQEWPKVATIYDLSFPQNHSTMYIHLDKDTLVLKKGTVPNQATFAYPGESAGVSRIVDLDAQAPSAPPASQP